MLKLRAKNLWHYTEFVIYNSVNQILETCDASLSRHEMTRLNTSAAFFCHATNSLIWTHPQFFLSRHELAHIRDTFL